MTTPDKIFRDQLAEYPKTPPSNAWTRVSTGLQRTRQRRLGYRIATIVVLLLIGGITFVSLQKPSTSSTHPPKPASEKPTPGMAHTPVSPAETNSAAEAQAYEEPVIQSAAKNEKVVRQSQTVTVNNANVTTENQTAITGQENSLTATAAPDTKTEIIAQPPPASALTEDPTTNFTSGKIVYHADDVNARFRRKKEIQTDTLDKPSSGLQKVVALAYGFKNDNTMLSDLRHMKNELFSLPGKKPARVQ